MGKDAAIPLKKKKKKRARVKTDKQRATDAQQVQSGAEEEAPNGKDISGMEGQANKGSANPKDSNRKGLAKDSIGEDAQTIPDEKPLAASSALESTKRPDGNSAQLASLLSEAEREKRKENKKQRRKAKRLAEKSAQKDQRSWQTSTVPEDGAAANVDNEPPGLVDSTEPKSQAAAHQNFVRANERNVKEDGPATKKSKKEKGKSREKIVALDTELRALKAYTNEQQIDNLDKGQLRGESKAVKDDIRDAKAEQERVHEDEKAGNREVEEPTQASAGKKRKKRQSNELTPEQSGSKPKKSRKRYKSKDQSSSPDFPIPMIQ